MGVYHTAKRREDSELLAVGPAATRIAEIFDDLVLLSRSGHVVNTELVEHAITAAARGARSTDIMNITVFRNARGRTVRPITTGQRSYVEAVAKNTITFGLGPAGSGKSFLAVASAVSALQQHHVRRIILTRPAVEAGEHLGFLPGDLMAKVDPYLRPLFDALDDLLGPDQTARYLDTGIIEVAPLAFMRGRTLNDSFIILDEAQNTTPEQLKMFLTRIGKNSKVIVTGDPSQADIPGARSALLDIERILSGVASIGFVHLSSGDIVRHPIVAAVVEAYENYQKHDPRP